MFTKQPKIEIEPNSRDRKLLKMGYILLGVHFLVIAIMNTRLPDLMPVHYNLKGKVDRFGDKSNIWFLPIISLGMFYGIELLIRKVKPHRLNYPVKVTEKNAAVLYRMSIQMLVILSLSIVILFLMLSLHTILQSFDLATYNFQYFFIPAIAIITLMPFYYIIKMIKIPKS